MNFDQPKLTPMQLGKRNILMPKHWETIDINNYKITKPTILCFGGNRSFDPRNANHYCRTVEGMLANSNYSKEIDKKNYEVLGICYGHYPLDESKVETSQLDKNEVSLIEKNLLQPLYLDENGNKLSCEDAKKNFNMLTILCHSYGAIAFDNVVKQTFQNMTDKGFSFDDIMDILSQVVCVSYAPRSLISGVSSIQIVSGCDGMDIPPNAPKKMRNTYYSRFFNLFNTKSMWGNGTQIANENTLGVYTTNMTNDEKADDHSMRALINAGKEGSEERSKNAKSIFYVAQQSLALSLKNSVDNVGSKVFCSKPNINQLYSKTKYILGKKQINLDMEML